jgi:hypothetical protein
MSWESFYFGCFLVGFLLSFVSVLAQAGHVHIPGAHHVGHVHGHAGSCHAPGADAQGGWLEKLNFATVTAFLAWFGGTGYLLTRYTSLWTLLAMGIAGLAGLAGGAAVFAFMAKLLDRDHTLNPEDFDMVGVLGRVSGTVFRNGTGEMAFTREGAHHSVPIRSEDGSAIEKDEEVVVTRYEKGIGYVRRWSELAGMTIGQ